MTSHPLFEILEDIGHGESGTVYRARDMALKRFVAVKELNASLRNDERRLAQFLEGAQFLAGLQHDHIVQVFSIDQQRGWLIMELMRGSLAAKLAEGPMAPDEVRSVVRQGLKGLAYLHSKDKLHGDIKPANLLLSAQGRIKLSDSAGAMVAGEFRKPTNKGKYLAPELLNPSFGPVGPGVDLYCLGFTALELLKGAAFDSLFKGVSARAGDAEIGWMRWHSSEERLPPAAELVRGLPDDLATVLDRVLAKRVADRFASADEALEQLKVRFEPRLEVPEPTKGAIQRPSTEPSVASAQVARATWPKAVPPAPVQVGPTAGVGRTTSRTGGGSASKSHRSWAVLLLLLVFLAGAVAFAVWRNGQEPDRANTNANAEKDRQDYEAAIAQAQSALSEKRYDDAIKEASNALELNPEDEAATKLRDDATKAKEVAAEFDKLLTQGKAALASKKYDDAIKSAQDALELIQEDETAIKLREDASKAKGAAAEFDKLLTQGKAALASKKYDDAIKSAQDALAFIPKDESAIKLRDDATKAKGVAAEFDKLLTQGKAALASKKYDDAIKSAQDALALIPKDESAIKLRDDATKAKGVAAEFDKLLTQGKAALASKKYDDAIKSAQDALALIPKDETAIKLRDDATTAKGVAAEFDKLLTQGKAALASKKYDDAIKSAKDALELIPKDEAAIKLRDDATKAREVAAEFGKLLTQGKAALALKKYDDAIKSAQDALELIPKDETAIKLRDDATKAKGVAAEFDKLLTQGKAALALKKYDDAIKSAQDALELIPKDETAIKLRDDATKAKGVAAEFDKLLTQGKAALALKKYDDAIKSAQDALELIPKDETAIKLRDDATKAKGVAAEFDKLLTQGKAALASKKYDDAIKSAQDALALIPKDETAIKLRDDATKAKGVAVEFDRLLSQAKEAMSLKKYEDAIKAANNALELIPEDKDATALRNDAIKAKEAEFTNTLSMKLVRIPKGKFKMGSPEGEGQADERPRHEVSITKDFYMGAYPITVGQFRAFVKAAKYKTEAETDGEGGMGFVGKDPFFEKATKYNWENTGFTQDDDHPVVNVSWNDAQAFCRWLSTKEGKTYRLPTEEEWEYACRAGTTTTWYCGDSEKGLKEVANIADVAFKKKISGFKSHDWDDGFAFTSPVGKFRANDFRLYDMHGNVWQWCDDWYAAYNEKGAKKEHVVRGGSWGTDAAACRSARRDKNPPGYRFNDLGFRVVCVVQ